MQVRFWGVRGSIPVPGPSTIIYGGNTACIEVRCGERLIVLDAGSGIRALGQALEHHNVLDFDLLLTHCHIDHLMGLPFFKPVFRAEAAIRMWAGHLKPADRLATIVKQFMIPPLLPITPNFFKADMTYRDFLAGDTLDLGGGIEVRSAALNHPGGATGYRITFEGRSLCYMTDHEHGPGEPAPSLLDLACNADLLIYDATYTPEEYVDRVGWGHSTWTEAIRFAAKAGVERVALFHHDPLRDDAELDAIVNEASRAFPGVFAAREGQVIELAGVAPPTKSAPRASSA